MARGLRYGRSSMYAICTVRRDILRGSWHGRGLSVQYHECSSDQALSTPHKVSRCCTACVTVVCLPLAPSTTPGGAHRRR